MDYNECIVQLIFHSTSCGQVIDCQVIDNNSLFIYLSIKSRSCLIKCMGIACWSDATSISKCLAWRWISDESRIQNHVQLKDLTKAVIHYLMGFPDRRQVFAETAHKLVRNRRVSFRLATEIPANGWRKDSIWIHGDMNYVNESD